MARCWEYNRNTVITRSASSSPRNGTLPFNQNQFGAAAGGPIVKNKLFVFADYEGFRRVYHPLQFASVPTTAMDNGDFSAYGLPITNPLTGAVHLKRRDSRIADRPIAESLTSARAESTGPFE